MMSSPLSKELRAKENVRSLPVRKNDQVKIVVGKFKGNEGKVQSVYRRRRCIYIEKVVKEKTNGQQANIPIHPSNCVITALKLDRDRKEMLKRKARTVDNKEKHKQINKMD
jgi:large subunit ribosomal protein L26e